MAGGLSVALMSVVARANCARPVGYEVNVVGNTVTICPINPDGRECPDADGMLRQSGEETIRVADECAVAADGTSCYVDECVPNGEYRYGFAWPYECCEYCCGTDYFELVSVGAGPAAGCTPDGGAPAPYSGDVPWSNSKLICSYGGGGAAGGSSGQGDAGDGAAHDASGGGCSCGLGVGFGAEQLVLAANALLALLGVGLYRRRSAPRA